MDGEGTGWKIKQWKGSKFFLRWKGGGEDGGSKCGSGRAGWKIDIGRAVRLGRGGMAAGGLGLW